MSEKILQLKNITVEFKLRNGVLKAVDNASIDVYEGEILGIVGESGSGKSTLASTILNIVSTPGRISSGEVIYRGVDVLKMSDEELRCYRWQNVSMVFQAAQNSMNPVLKIKEQILETVFAHKDISEREVMDKARKLLEYVRLDAEQVLNSYPHQLSGGMKQRTIIAMSLLLDPDIIILDEPTTALDVITQAYIMDILKTIHRDLGITMIFLTHDVSIIGKVADRIAVMYASNVVEIGSVEDAFYRSKHPYTNGLIHAAPSLIDDITCRRAIPGMPPNMMALPSGCRFNPRCSLCGKKMCTGMTQGELKEVTPGHFTTCVEWERIEI
jgi:peptide/nickel transport system ATP-binding protein